MGNNNTITPYNILLWENGNLGIKVYANDIKNNMYSFYHTILEYIYDRYFIPNSQQLYYFTVHNEYMNKDCVFFVIGQLHKYDLEYPNSIIKSKTYNITNSYGFCVKFKTIGDVLDFIKSVPFKCNLSFLYKNKIQGEYKYLLSFYCNVQTEKEIKRILCYITEFGKIEKYPNYGEIIRQDILKKDNII